MMLWENVVLLGSLLIVSASAESCDGSKLRTCYEGYLKHFGMSASKFPSHERYEHRTETYMSNEPILARPTLCDWHRALARCIAPSCITKDSLKTTFGLSDREAYFYALSFETNEFECGEGFPTITDYVDCVEEVRNCKPSEVDAAVQGCTNLHKKDIASFKVLRAPERSCKMQRVASECYVQFAVSKCGYGVEDYYCKLQEFLGKRKHYDDPTVCLDAYRCDQ